ncbi:hypothetical protein SHAM105786_05910 [Shewanella amazonensis]|uniref:YcxB-like protein domain-containing protein n=1 Tax=Shewanella amazonensis (strain ATCC BAA-1098 / SB2B) TaxID=326297 RepID=A1S9D7_SHEAM|nr:hypothetical protein [Shewanella amazonensis]ABM00994.1 conserved hypothetical protein [Shewanella amazonensis SB2B]
MPTSLYHQHSFILNRAHFEECFDESVTPLTGPKRHIKTLGFGLMTFALLASPLPSYLGWFFLGLTVLEFLSVRYQRTWWLWRQLMSRAAGNEVTLTVTDTLLITESLGQKRELAWDSLDAITPTARGFLLQRGRARQYLSASGLSSDAQAFLTKFHRSDDAALAQH